MLFVPLVSCCSPQAFTYIDKILLNHVFSRLKQPQQPLMKDASASHIKDGSAS